MMFLKPKQKNVNAVAAAVRTANADVKMAENALATAAVVAAVVAAVAVRKNYSSYWLH